MAHLRGAPRDFWPLSPRTFCEILDELSERREAENAREDYRTGLLASLLYNPNRRKGAKALDAEDFFPALADLMESAQGEGGDIEELVAYVRQFDDMLGGGGLTSANP